MKHFISSTGVVLTLFFSCCIGVTAQEQDNKTIVFSPRYEYRHRSGDTLQVLHLWGIGTKRLYFTLFRKVGKDRLKEYLKGYTKIISDCELDENEAGEGVPSQEYSYERGTLYYTFRTDEEQNSFLRLQVYDLSDDSNSPIHHYFFKRHK